VTFSENNNKLIKDWIRPLQKSLTIETENKAKALIKAME